MPRFLVRNLNIYIQYYDYLFLGHNAVNLKILWAELFPLFMYGVDCSRCGNREWNSGYMVCTGRCKESVRCGSHQDGGTCESACQSKQTSACG